MSSLRGWWWWWGNNDDYYYMNVFLYIYFIIQVPSCEMVHFRVDKTKVDIFRL